MDKIVSSDFRYGMLASITPVPCQQTPIMIWVFQMVLCPSLCPALPLQQTVADVVSGAWEGLEDPVGSETGDGMPPPMIPGNFESQSSMCLMERR